MGEQMSEMMIVIIRRAVSCRSRRAAFSACPSPFANPTSGTHQTVTCITNVLTDGRWIAVEAVGRGRFRNGPEYENRYSFWVEVDGRTIRTIREYMDSHYVATQTP